MELQQFKSYTHLIDAKVDFYGTQVPVWLEYEFAQVHLLFYILKCAYLYVCLVICACLPALSDSPVKKKIQSAYSHLVFPYPNRSWLNIWGSVWKFKNQ